MAKQAIRCCWKQLSSCGTTPAPRSSHTVTAVAGRVCVFGGEDAPRRAFDPVPHFLQSDGSWQKGSCPIPGGPLIGHGAASLGSRLFVYGGRTGGTAFTGTPGEVGDLWSFDLEAAGAEASDAWQHLEGGQEPGPRSYHAMCAAREAQQFFVFGGCGPSGRLNDLWRFDVAQQQWLCVHPGGEGAPKPRGGASLVASLDGLKVLLLFGFSGAQQGDVALFDVPSGRWRILEQQAQRGAVPTPRSVCATTFLEGIGAQGTVVLFGGERVASDQGHEGAGEFASDLYALDVDSMEWTTLTPAGQQGPTARGWGAMAVRSEASALLFGGLNVRNDRLGDAWELTLDQ